MTLPRTLLVPLDGSPVAEMALPYAEAFAKATGTSIHLLSVIEPVPRGLTSRSTKRAAEIEQAQREALQGALTVAADRLGRAGLDVSLSVMDGPPAETILAAARSDTVAIVVMGTHGRGGVDRWGVGSVADTVMRASPKPMLLVRLPYTPASQRAPLRPVTLGRLMVPLDGSALAEGSLPLAADLADATGATLTLVRVEPWVTIGSAPYGAVAEFTEMEERAAAEAARYLDDVRRRLPKKVNAETIVLRGRPAESLIDFAQYERIDLVIMTTHGRGGVRRLVMGSVADRLVRAGVTMLLVPAGAVASLAPSGPAPAAGTARPARTAAEIMAQPVVTVREDATLDEAARLMLQHRIGCLPVVDEHGVLRGIVTESDFTGEEQTLPFSAYRAPKLFGQWASKQEIEAALEAGRSLIVREIMSAPVETVQEDDPIGDVVERMLRHDINRIPVVRDGVPVGIIARHDLLRMIAGEDGSGRSG